MMLIKRYPTETDIAGTAVQDVNVSVSEADGGMSQSITLGAGRQAYLVTVEGGLTAYDAARPAGRR